MRGNYAAEGPYAFRGRLADGARERREQRFARMHHVGAGSGGRSTFLIEQADRWGAPPPTTSAPIRRGLRLAPTAARG